MSRVMIVTVMVAMSACAYAPYNGQIFDRQSDFEHVYGLGTRPSARIFVEVFSRADQRWQIADIGGTSATPSVAAGTWTNGPALYAYSSGGRPMVLPSLWDYVPSLGLYSATLRVRQNTDAEGDQFLFVGEANSASCFLTAMNAGKDFYQGGYDCGYDGTSLTVYARSLQ